LPRKTSLEGLDKTIIDFLASQKIGTQHTYKCLFKQILTFTGMTGQQILESKKADKTFEWERKIIEFKTWMKQQKNRNGITYSDNAVGTAVNTLRSFFDYYRTPLLFNQNESRKINGKSQRVTKDYMLTNDDISKLVFVGDLREKYIVLLGKSFGLRAGDFASLTYGCFRSINLDSEAPIFVGEFQTQKEGVTAYPFVDSDALPILKAVLDSNKDKSNSERIFPVKDEELSSIVQTLATKANINLGDKHLRFHCFRKWLIDRLSSMMSESKWKQIVGKAISEGAYVSNFELKESYSKAMKLTTVLLNGNGKVSKKVEEMEGEFQLTKSQLAEVIAKQQKDKEELLQQIKSMYEFVHKNLDPLLDVIDEISKTPEGSEALRKYRAKKQAEMEV
jgi:integrase